MKLEAVYISIKFILVSVLAACLVLVSIGGINAAEVSSVQNVVTVDAATTSSAYLSPSKNCQVTSTQIKSRASSITRGSSSQQQKAVKIFNWVRDNTRYTYYINTRYGAVNTLSKRSGNCVDHAHLLVALSRASGIPAKYVYATVRFNNGKVSGHVWAEMYVNGKWSKADATSNVNSFGTIRSWKNGSVKGTFASMPF